MNRKLIGLGVVALVLALLLTLAPACGKGEGPGPGVTPTPGAPGVTPTPTPQAKELKIGALCSLSGPAATWGTEILEGIKWAADKYNATGFKVGADTYVIKIVKGDDKFIGSAAAEEIIRMISGEGIHYVTGPIGTYAAIGPIAKEGKCFVFNVTNSELIGPHNPYLLIGAAPVRTWYPTFWDQAYKFYPQIKTVAIVTPDPTTYDPHLASEKGAHERHGTEVVMTKRYTIFASDYYPVLTPVVAKNPDCVSFCAGNKGDIDLMIKQIRELGYRGIIASGAHGDPQSTIDVAGCKYAEGFLMNDPDYSSKLYPESTRKLYAEFQRTHPGRPLALTTYLGYGSIDLYVQAIQKAGSTDPDEVMKVLDDPNFEFQYFGMPGVTLGGFETFGVRRCVNDEVCYSEVINCKKVMKSRAPAITP